MLTQMLLEKIREMETDRTSGASQIARNALNVLKLYAQTGSHKSPSEFVEELHKLGRQLSEARPNMAPVQNLVAQIVYEVAAAKQKDLAALQRFTVARIDKLLGDSQKAVEEAAQHAANRVANSSHIATCSYSSTVCEAFKTARQQGKHFKVYVAESRSVDGQLSHGEKLAYFLKDNGITVEVFPDSNILEYISRADCVLIGADSILFGGSIINGTPSYALAAAAKECGLPVYSVCETAKANPTSFLDEAVELEQGFDRVPASLITGIVTEQGVLDQKSVASLMNEKAKFLTALTQK